MCECVSECAWGGGWELGGGTIDGEPARVGQNNNVTPWLCSWQHRVQLHRACLSQRRQPLTHTLSWRGELVHGGDRQPGAQSTLSAVPDPSPVRHQSQQRLQTPSPLIPDDELNRLRLRFSSLCSLCSHD